MTPLTASYGLFGAWVISWFAAAVWAKPATARPSILAEAANRIPTLIGYWLIIVSGRWQFARIAEFTSAPPLWRLDDFAGWALVACELAGFAFTWWARIHLGTLWSSEVTRKEGHHIVDTGPYRLVRHPIYTGLLFATLAFAVVIGKTAALLGFAFAWLGFWLKARLEERFLIEGLGPQAYGEYRRRTQMLVPFWPQLR